MNIDPIYFAVVMLLQVSGTNLVGSATGFFFQTDNHHYLVSNRHVFTGETLPAQIPRPDHLAFRIHSSPTDLLSDAICSLAILGTNNAPLWYEHPLGAHIDLAMLPIDESFLTNSLVIRWLSPKDFPPDGYGGGIAQQMFVIGFPQGFDDALFNLPIVRQAFSASAYGVPFRGNPYFMLDARLHPGSSGSPVFSQPTHTIPAHGSVMGGMTMAGPGFTFFVGVNSAELKPLRGQTNALGLNAVWYPDLLVDIDKHAHGNQVTTNVAPPVPVPSLPEILEKQGFSKQFFPNN